MSYKEQAIEFILKLTDEEAERLLSRLHQERIPKGAEREKANENIHA